MPLSDFFQRHLIATEFREECKDTTAEIRIDTPQGSLLGAEETPLAPQARDPGISTSPAEYWGESTGSNLKAGMAFAAVDVPGRHV